MEKLLASAILFSEKIISEETYQNILHEMFLQMSDEELLLELEWNTDIKKSVGIIREYFSGRQYDEAVFGRFFLQKIKEKYWSNDMDIHDFGVRMYNIWEALPGNLQNKEPFL